jgi:hypothetical protein
MSVFILKMKHEVSERHLKMMKIDMPTIWNDISQNKMPQTYVAKCNHTTTSGRIQQEGLTIRISLFSLCKMSRK